MMLDKLGKLQYQDAKEIQELLDLARAKGRDYLHDILVPIAACALLRWAGYQEDETAVASFDNYPSEPVLAKNLNWSFWNERGFSQLQRFLHERLLGIRTGDDQANDLPETLRTLAQTLDPEREDSDLWRAVVSWALKLPFQTGQDRQRFSELFEALIGAVISRTRYGGELFTPGGVVELLVDLAAPQPGERIYDPCFGTGGLLAAAGRRIITTKKSSPAEALGDLQRCLFYGVELQPALFLIGMARLILAGIPMPHLECVDALARTIEKNPSSEGFDCILAHFPFGVRVSREGSRVFPIKATTIETLFLQHIMASLRPGGRAAVIVPDSALFRLGPDARVREQLITEFRIDGVFSLSSRVFRPYTAIKTSILCFSRETPRKEVWFVEDKFTATALEPGEKGTNRRGLFGDLIALRRGTGIRQLSSAFRRELKPLHNLLQTLSSRSVEKPTDASDIWDEMAVFSFISSVEELGIDSSSFLRESGFRAVAWRVAYQDLATRNFELIVKRTGAEEVDVFLEELQEARLEIPITTLGDIAEIFSGVEYRRSVVSEKSENPESVGLIRVADIPKNGATSLANPADHNPVEITIVLGEDGQKVRRNVSDFALTEARISSPTLFLSKEGLRHIKDRHRLQLGDILVTSYGTVGKVGLVQESIVGCAPVNSIIVIRLQKDLQPSFLRRLLQSEPYQDWFGGHAQGTTIRHLDIRTVRSLRVPILPIQVQQRIGVTLASGADSGLLLWAFIAGETADEIEAFLLSDPSIRDLLESHERFDDFENVRSFSALAAALAPWETRATHDEVGDELASWFMKITKLSRLVSDAFELPKGTERLAMLEGSRVQLTELQLAGVWSLFRDVGPSVRQRAEAITNAIAKTVESERRKLLEQVELSASLEPSIVDERKLSEVTVQLKNESVLPLRKLYIQTEPDRSDAVSQFFQVGHCVSWPVTISPRATGIYPLSVNWRGIRLDGEPTSGEISLAFEIRVSCATPRSEDLGDNPYIVGRPVERPEMFFGRQSLLDQIRRQLNVEHHANIILLEGNRRTGKSSILRYLARPGELPGWIPAYCQFQRGEGDDKAVGLPTREVFYLIAAAMALAIHKDGFSVEIPSLGIIEGGRFFNFHLEEALNRYFAGDRPFQLLEALVATWLEVAQPKRVLLMLDEFDKLQEGIDNGLTSPQVPENIRYLFHAYQGLSGILTGSRRLKRLREEYWSALFGLGYRIGLDPLEVEEASALVTAPVKGRLVYVPEARDLVVTLCARQPFLIQSLCNRIFEYCARNGERMVSSRIVKAAADEMITDNEHFHTLWDYMKTNRRRFLFCLIDRYSEGPDRVSVEFLDSKFNEYGVIRGKRERIGDDLDFLRELEVIELDQSALLPTYCIGIPLMARWLRKNKDWEDVRERAAREGEEKTL